MQQGQPASLPKRTRLRHVVGHVERLDHPGKAAGGRPQRTDQSKRQQRSAMRINHIVRNLAYYSHAVGRHIARHQRQNLMEQVGHRKKPHHRCHGDQRRKQAQHKVVGEPRRKGHRVIPSHVDHRVLQECSPTVPTRIGLTSSPRLDSALFFLGSFDVLSFALTSMILFASAPPQKTSTLFVPCPASRTSWPLAKPATNLLVWNIVNALLRYTESSYSWLTEP